jgi:hypothetical protein
LVGSLVVSTQAPLHDVRPGAHVAASATATSELLSAVPSVIASAIEASNTSTVAPSMVNASSFETSVALELSGANWSATDPSSEPDEPPPPPQPTSAAKITAKPETRIVGVNRDAMTAICFLAPILSRLTALHS